MIEREKVITALECCKDVHQSGRWASGCISCGYADKHRPDCFLSLADDAMELLKEQETSDTGKARMFQCEKCGYGFDDIFLIDEHNYDIEPRYCPNCGRAVKWDA